jgi:hypothetical protein
MDYDQLKGQITDEDRIVLWSCNDCTKYSNLGGRENLDALAKALVKDGYNVTHQEIIGVGCQPPLIRLRSRHPATKEIFDNATVIIVLACTDGFLKTQRVFRKHKVIQVGESVGLGAYSKEGGMKLVIPLEGIGLSPSIEGYTLEEAAKKLGKKSGPLV